MINTTQLLRLIIDPALDALKMNSAAARRLLLFTCASESRMGTYIKQFPVGPALSIYQLERRTYYDLWDSVLEYKPRLTRKVLNICEYVAEPSANCLMWDLRLATVMARIQYWRWPERLPEADDEEGLIKYYYKYWAPNPKFTSLEDATSRINSILNLGDKHEYTKTA